MVYIVFRYRPTKQNHMNDQRRKKQGRPSLEGTPLLPTWGVRFSAKEFDMLTKHYHQPNVPKNTLIRVALRNYLAQNPEKISV